MSTTPVVSTSAAPPARVLPTVPAPVLTFADAVDVDRWFDVLGFRRDDLVAVCSQEHPAAQGMPTGTFHPAIVPVAEVGHRALVNLVGHNVWASAQPLRAGALSREAGDVDRVTNVYADVDVKAGGPPDMVAAGLVVKTLSDRLGAEPAVVVETGHGLHPRWPLDGDVVDRAAGEVLLRRMRTLVTKVYAELGYGLPDPVYDRARILRVPGTANRKEDDEQPLPVLARFSEDVEYVHADVLQRWEPWAAPAAASTAAPSADPGVYAHELAQALVQLDQVAGLAAGVRTPDGDGWHVGRTVGFYIRLAELRNAGVDIDTALAARAASWPQAFTDYVRGRLHANRGASPRPAPLVVPPVGFDPTTVEVVDGPPAAQASDADPDAVPSSWVPVDLEALLAAEVDTPVPTLLRRHDVPELGLLYPGKVHTLMGESESGKSWVSLLAAAQVLTAGGRALLIDSEEHPLEAVRRLRLLGLPDDVIRRVAIVNPETAVTADEASKAAYRVLLDTQWDLVVIDSVERTMALEGTDSNASGPVSAWMQTLPLLLARHTGAAVVIVDHVTKPRKDAAPGADRYALGSQAKLASVGVAIRVAPEGGTPPAPGAVGRVLLTVTKDRYGALVRGTQFRVTVDSTAPTGDQAPTRMRVELVRDASPEGADEASDRDRAQRASRVLRLVRQHPEGCSLNAVDKGVNGNNEDNREALQHLVDRGIVIRTGKGKKGTAFIHTVVDGWEELATAAGIGLGVTPVGEWDPDDHLVDASGAAGDVTR